MQNNSSYWEPAFFMLMSLLMLCASVWAYHTEGALATYFTYLFAYGGGVLMLLSAGLFWLTYKIRDDKRQLEKYK